MPIDEEYLRTNLGRIHPFFLTGDFREKYRWLIEEALQKEDHRKDVVKRRLEGETLQSIASSYGTNRERIRQIEVSTNIDLRRFARYGHQDIINALFLNELQERLDSGQATPYEAFLYNELNRVKSSLEGQIASLKSQIASLEDEKSGLEKRIYEQLGLEVSAEAAEVPITEFGIPSVVINQFRRRCYYRKAGDLVLTDRKAVRSIGEFGDARYGYLRTAMGFLGLPLCAEKTDFPPLEEFLNMPAGFIISQGAANRLAGFGIEKVCDLPEKYQPEMGYGEEVLRAIKFYGLNTLEPDQR